MSGGSGQMPAASNKGQQMQNPQMGQQGMMGGQMPPYQMAQQMPPQGGMFGGMQPQSTFSDSASGQPYMGQVPMGSPMMQNGMGAMPMQTAQQIPGGPQMDQSMLQQMMQAQQMQGAGGGMQPDIRAGIAGLGGQMPMSGPDGRPQKPYMGDPIDYGTPRFPPQVQNPNGMPQTYPPYQPYMGGPDIKPTNMGKPEGMLPAGGMPPGFRPTSIDGRRLRDMMDITKRRFMGNMGGMRGRDEGDQDRLPGAIGNDLPPALRRPTQGGYSYFK